MIVFLVNLMKKIILHSKGNLFNVKKNTTIHETSSFLNGRFLNAIVGVVFIIKNDGFFNIQDQGMLIFLNESVQCCAQSNQANDQNHCRYQNAC